MDFGNRCITGCGAIGIAPISPQETTIKPTYKMKSTALLLSDDLAALKRFAECCEDACSGGHDVAKDRMARLSEIGAVESKGFGRYQVTAFGGYVLALENDEAPVLPLKTYADYAEAARRSHLDKLSSA